MRDPSDWTAALLSRARTDPTTVHLIVRELQAEAIEEGYRRGMGAAISIATRSDERPRGHPDLFHLKHVG